ncbi:MAG: TadE/TadG family type IV pilus assembly protein [Bacillota bacterium]
MKLNKKGQSVVETAIILPIILLLLMGMFEISRIFGSYLLINYVSRESARMAAVGRTDDEIVQSIYDKSALLNLENVQIIIEPEESSRRTGDNVNVLIKYRLTIYAPIVQSLIPNPFNMEANTIMRVE